MPFKHKTHKWNCAAKERSIFGWPAKIYTKTNWITALMKPLQFIIQIIRFPIFPVTLHQHVTWSTHLPSSQRYQSWGVQAVNVKSRGLWCNAGLPTPIPVDLDFTVLFQRVIFTWYLGHDNWIWNGYILPVLYKPVGWFCSTAYILFLRRPTRVKASTWCGPTSI